MASKSIHARTPSFNDEPPSLVHLPVSSLSFNTTTTTTRKNHRLLCYNTYIRKLSARLLSGAPLNERMDDKLSLPLEWSAIERMSGRLTLRRGEGAGAHHLEASRRRRLSGAGASSVAPVRLHVQLVRLFQRVLQLVQGDGHRRGEVEADSLPRHGSLSQTSVLHLGHRAALQTVIFAFCKLGSGVEWSWGER